MAATSTVVKSGSEREMTGHDAPRQGYRCLVLVCDETTIIQDLLSGLIKRGTRLQVVHDPCHLLVELAREPTGLVILAQPQQVSGLRELIVALRRYYPHTACWRCETVNQQTRLLRIHKAGLANPLEMNKQRSIRYETETQSAPHVFSHNPREENHGLESTRQRQLPSLLRDDEASHPQSAQSLPEPGNGRLHKPNQEGRDGQVNPLITQEELAMLIGPEFGCGDLDAFDHTRDWGSSL